MIITYQYVLEFIWILGKSVSYDREGGHAQTVIEAQIAKG